MIKITSKNGKFTKRKVKITKESVENDCVDKNRILLMYFWKSYIFWKVF